MSVTPPVTAPPPIVSKPPTMTAMSELSTINAPLQKSGRHLRRPFYFTQTVLMLRPVCFQGIVFPSTPRSRDLGLHRSTPQSCVETLHSSDATKHQQHRRTST